MDKPGSNRRSIEGQLNENGDVRCLCGKKVGHTTRTSVEFYCRACHADVFLSSDLLRLRIFARALDAVERILQETAALQNTEPPFPEP